MKNHCASQWEENNIQRYRKAFSSCGEIIHPKSVSYEMLANTGFSSLDLYCLMCIQNHYCTKPYSHKLCNIACGRSEVVFACFNRMNHIVP